MSSNTVNPSGSAPTGIQVYSPTGALSSINPNATAQVVGYNGTTTPGVVTLQAGSNISLTQTGAALTVASTATGTPIGSGSSPVNFQSATLSSNVPVTTAYTINSPAIGATQVIQTLSISPTSATSQIVVGVAVTSSITNTSNLNIQYLIYSSTSTSTPLITIFDGNGAMTTNAPSNTSSKNLKQKIASTGVGSTITFSFCATTLSGTPSILSAGFYLYCYEVLPNNAGIAEISSSAFSTGSAVTATYTSTSQPLNTTTTIAGPNFNKAFNNTGLLISVDVPLTGIIASTPVFAGIMLYIALGSSVPGTTTPIQPVIYQASLGYVNTSATNLNSCIGCSWFIPASSLPAGAGQYTLALGAVAESSANPWNIIPVSIPIIIEEVTPASYAGLININNSFINQVNIANFSATVPTFANATILGSVSIITRANGSTVIVTAQLTLSTGPSSGETSTLFCFYTSNAPGATPIASVLCSSAATGTGFNPHTSSYFFSFNSAGANLTTTIYVGAVSQETGYVANSTAAQFYLIYEEVLASTTGSAISSVTAASNSYLTATTSASAVTIGTQQASTSQAGLIAVGSAGVPNSIPMFGSSIAAPIQAQARGYNFVTNLFLNFGGAHVGQGLGPSFAAFVYNNQGVAIPTSLSGLGSVVYEGEIWIGLNVTALGSSTGAATISGLPVTPLFGTPAFPEYYIISAYSGINIANGNILTARVVSGSSTIDLYTYDINANTYTAVSNTTTTFTAPLFLRLSSSPLLVSTAPP